MSITIEKRKFTPKKKKIPVVRIVSYRISKVKRLVVWQTNAPQLQAIVDLIFEGQTPE